MIKVLQIVDNMDAGGIQSFIMNVYRRIDKEKIQFDFLVCKRNPLYGNEIDHLGGKIYYVPARNQGIFANRKALKDFFSRHHEYDVVHMHESSLSYIDPLIAAKRVGTKKLLIHSHNTRVPGSALHKILHRFNQTRIGNIATDYIACGEMAADWMFGRSAVIDKVQIIYNGIDLKKFEFDPVLRDTVRNELEVNNDFVIGHAGRFETVKNHVFLLDVFSEILKMQPQSVLLLAGTGSLVDTVKMKAETLGIGDKIRFLGVRNDIHRLYQAMDCFVLPSLYEGFPVSIIEAEASGLPCVMADTITKETCLKKNVAVLDLAESKSAWAEKILQLNYREIDNSLLYSKGFDIENTVQKLYKLYSE